MCRLGKLFVFTCSVFFSARAAECFEPTDTIRFAASERLESLLGPLEEDSQVNVTTFGESLQSWDDHAASTKTFGPRFARLEYDFDNRGFNVLHFMGAAPLPHKFHLWGFIDIEGADLLGSNREDLSRYFLELDVKRRIGESDFGVVAELNDMPGTNNSIGRLGLFYLPKWDILQRHDLFLYFKVFAYETDGRGSQFSLSWNKKFPNCLGGRVSAGGFLDVNFRAIPGNETIIIVQEHQVRFRVLDGLHVITEFRQNQFLGDSFGIAPGIQYRF